MVITDYNISSIYVWFLNLYSVCMYAIKIVFVNKEMDEYCVSFNYYYNIWWALHHYYIHNRWNIKNNKREREKKIKMSISYCHNSMQIDAITFLDNNK